MSEHPGADVEQWRQRIDHGSVVPFFQAIFSTQSQTVFGYEVLGRVQDSDGAITSLGQLFEAEETKRGSIDPFSALQTLKRDVDREIRFAALRYFKDHSHPATKLFMNLSPLMMLRHRMQDSGKLPASIAMIRELGIAPDRIVVEITEESIPQHLDEVLANVRMYREEGYLIALDDIGSKSSNLDRIGLFHPDIIKVDLEMIKRSISSRNFREILYSLSQLSDSIGIAVLIEGIENEEELYNALDNGAQYLQGYLLARPQAGFEDRGAMPSSLGKGLSDFYKRKADAIKKSVRWENAMKRRLSAVDLHVGKNGSAFDRVKAQLYGLDGSVLRFYVTDQTGVQISPNFVRDELNFRSDPAHKSKNWSTRPYFFNHIHHHLSGRRSWCISGAYWDIHTRTLVRTFSRALETGAILFIDVQLDDA